MTLHPIERAFPEAAPSDSAHISLVRTVSHDESICKAVWEIQLLGTLLSLTKTDSVSKEEGENGYQVGN